MLLGGAVLETREILTRFKNGELSMEEAEHYFRKEPFEEMEVKSIVSVIDKAFVFLNDFPFSYV